MRVSYWLRPNEVLPFAELYAEKERQTVQRNFCAAVEAALEDLEERVTDGSNVTPGQQRVTGC